MLSRACFASFRGFLWTIDRIGRSGSIRSIGCSGIDNSNMPSSSNISQAKRCNDGPDGNNDGFNKVCIHITSKIFQIMRVDTQKLEMFYQESEKEKEKEKETD